MTFYPLICYIDDMYRLTEYEKQKLLASEAAVEAGQVVSHEEVEAEFKNMRKRDWTSPYHSSSNPKI